jgi:hypothetical protein
MERATQTKEKENIDTYFNKKTKYLIFKALIKVGIVHPPQDNGESQTNKGEKKGKENIDTYFNKKTKYLIFKA